MTNGTGEPRIDAELLAALMEGRLSDEERAQVLATLAESAPDRELLGDAAAAFLALEEADGVAPVAEGSPAAPEAPHPSVEADPPLAGGDPQAAQRSAPGSTASSDRSGTGFRWKVWLPLAAVVAAVSVIPLLDSPARTDVGSLRSELLALGPVRSPLDLPAVAGADPTRSAATAPGDPLLDSLTATARSFRRGAAFARLTLLTPNGRRDSEDAAVLAALLGSTSGAVVRTGLEAWFQAADDDEAAWRRVADDLESLEGEPAAFRLGMAVEAASLRLAFVDDGDPGPGVAETIETGFEELDSEARAALSQDFSRLQVQLQPRGSGGVELATALDAFAGRARNLYADRPLGP